MNIIDLDNLTQEDIAKFIAYRAHDGQYRRDGVTPYIIHPAAVADSFPKDATTERAVAWLHDVLEDNKDFCTYVLRLLGVDVDVIDAVLVLTKKPGQRYDDYIADVLDNPLAAKVKIADIRHNLSCQPTEKARVKYGEALNKLLAATGK